MAESLPEIPFPAEQAADADEVEFWRGVERKLRALCDPLARAVRPKNITWAMQFSESQLSKELSGTDDKHLSARVLLYIAHKTQQPELLRYIVCDLFKCKPPEKQNPPDLREENEQLRAENARLKALMRAGLEADAPVLVGGKP